MIQIRQEAEDIVTGKQPRDNNVLKNAPHPISVISLADKEWNKYVGHILFSLPLVTLCTGHIRGTLLLTLYRGY
jgi:glycine dehydrogenase